MLFTADAWPGIADGSITLTFRTWQRAQAKAGGRYRVGGMLIEAVDVRQVPAGGITPEDAARSGAADLAALLTRLGNPNHDTLIWRVEFRYLGADDRIERREQGDLTPEEVDDLRARLDRMDHRASGRPWTRGTLALIAKYPGVVSTALARRAGYERQDFKVNVRKLKELGLTESLDVGYRLSPRGEALLRALQ